MIVVMRNDATDEMVRMVEEKLQTSGYRTNRSVGVSRTIVGAIGDKVNLDARQFELMPGVAEVLRVSEPYKLASRAFHPDDTVIKVRQACFGGGTLSVMAGPCSVEDEQQMMTIAKQVSSAGAKVLRGGTFKPRTSPYSFQGLGLEGLKLLRAAADAFELATISEVMELSQIDMMMDDVDIFQVGARNMQNFNLLRRLGETHKPVMLKRGLAATIEELLMSAEYILAGGNTQLILCERGIRTFEKYTRNTFDVSAIPVVQGRSHIPIVADPSHGIGIRDKVAPMARAAVAAGVDGLIIEVHHDPDHAMSDGAQSLYPQQFSQLMDEIRTIAWAIGKKLA